MHAHYLQHVPFEGLGSIEEWLDKNSYTVTATKFYESTLLPELDSFELLLVMGGPMGIKDVNKYPWLRIEKQFIKSAIDAGKMVLGICLGAQLIADVMGASVYPNRRKEIGWFPISRVSQNEVSFIFPESLTVFHWHGETFDLPQGAVHLAQSIACKNQAFQIGQSVIGLQFHLETTADSAAAIVKHCKEELVPSEFVQTDTEILSISTNQYVEINQLMSEILTYLHTHRN